MAEGKELRLSLTGESHDAVEFIRIARKRENRGFVVGEAVAIYRFMVEQQLKGNTICVRHADGTYRDIELP